MSDAPPRATLLSRALISRVLDTFSLVQPWREHPSDCTYCRRRRNNGRVSLTAFLSRLTVFDYDALLERGWMRSGTSLYLPSNARSCCPNLPIRLDAVHFEPSRSQKAAVRRVLDVVAGRRALTLPDVDEDPLLRCLALARAGRAEEAAEVVVRNRVQRTALGTAAPDISARARALGIRFLSEGAACGGVDEDDARADVTVDGAGGAGVGEGMCVDRDDGQRERGESLGGVAGGGAGGGVSGGGSTGGGRAVGFTLAKAPAPVHLHDLLRTSFGPVDSSRALVIESAPHSHLVVEYVAALLVEHFKGPQWAAVTPDVLAGVRAEVPSAKARKAATAVTRVPDATCNAAFVFSSKRIVAGASMDIARRLASDLTAASPFRPTISLRVEVAQPGFLNFFIDASSREELVAILCELDAAAIASMALSGERARTRAEAMVESPRDAQAVADELFARVPHSLHSGNASTIAERAAVARFHAAQQAAREADGRRAFKSDPLYCDTGKIDEDDSTSDDDGGGARAPSPSAAETKARKRAAKEDASIAKEIAASVASLRTLETEGVGSCAAALRARAEAARAASGGGDGGVGGERALLRPFPDGSVPLTVSFARPAYSLEAHELYGRFNMALHKGRPASEEKTSYKRHLIDSILQPAPAWTLGAAVTAGDFSAREEFHRHAAEARDFYAHHEPGVLFFDADQRGPPLVSPLVSGVGAGSGAAQSPPPLPSGASPSASLPSSDARALRAALPCFEIGDLLSFPGGGGGRVGSLRDVFTTVARVADCPTFAPAPEDAADGGDSITADLSAIAADDPLASWLLLNVGRVLCPSSLLKNADESRRVAADFTLALERAQTPDLASAGGDAAASPPPVFSTSRFISDRLRLNGVEKSAHIARPPPEFALFPPEESSPPLPACFAPVVRAARAQLEGLGPMLPGAFVLAIYAVALELADSAKTAIILRERHAAHTAVWRARRAEVHSLLEALYGPDDVLRDSAAEFISYTTAMDPRSTAALVMAACRAAMAAVTPPFFSGVPAEDATHVHPFQSLTFAQILAAVTVQLDKADPPPSSPPEHILDPDRLTPAALRAAVSTWIDAHDATMAWLEGAITSALEEAMSMACREAPSKGQGRGRGRKAGRGGSAERDAAVSAAADTWFDSWIVRAPTQGAGRHGAVPLRSEAAFVAERDASAARARERGAVSVAGWDLPFGYGTFFMEYRLGDTGDLVAVSVVDILPSRVASVYFFYSPDARDALQLGKLSVLVEAWLAREIASFSAAHPALTTMLPRDVGPPGGWLDLNFYVHTCPQMRYKRDFHPSQVLDPARRAWTDLTRDVLARLDVAPTGPLLGPRAAATGRNRDSIDDDSDGGDGGGDDDDDVALTATNAENENALAVSLLPLSLCRLNDGGWHPFGDLTVVSRDACTPSFLSFFRATGPALGSRLLIDPNSASYVGWQVAEKKKAREAAREAAARRRAEEAARAAAADEEDPDLAEALRQSLEDV